VQEPSNNSKQASESNYIVKNSSRNIVAGIATEARTGQSRNRNSITVRDMRCTVIQNIQIGCASHTPSHFFDGYRGLSLGGKATRGVKMTTNLQPMPRLRMNGATTPFPTWFHPVHTNGLSFTFVDEITAAQLEKEFPLEGSLACSLVPYLPPKEISQHLTILCLFR